MKKVRVIFQPSGREGKVEQGRTALDVARQFGIGIESICGGEKTCGKCQIRVLEGNVSPFTDEEAHFISNSKRAIGYRLSCSVTIQGDSVFFVPEESLVKEQVVRKGIRGRSIELKPAVLPYSVEPDAPSFRDLLGDYDRLQRALFQKYGLSNLKMDYPTLLKVPKVLREGNWNVTGFVWMDQKLVDIRPGRVENFYGLAIDIGTTTVAGYLCNLRNGEIVATESLMNPQVTYGEDVMSRITYTMTHPDGLQTLHRTIIEGLNQLIATITEKANLSPNDILELTIVGNTAMHHLLLELNPQYLGVSPFPPAIQQSIDLKARDLGLRVHASANVHMLPIEAGFVGADNVGVLLALEPYNQEETVLVIDVGTNGELVMGNREKLISASCATGPAFEGATIQFGMRAAPGAIERVEIDPKTFEVRFEAIGNTRPMGICGSGIIDAVAEMYRCGIIDKSGRFRKEIRSPRLRVLDETPEFVIAWRNETCIDKDITITQKDVRNVQLAKAALYAGAKLMMRRLGIKKLDKVILAGAFGSTIDSVKAMIIGMFPDCDLKNVHAVGNAAGDGARIALLNKDKRAEADEIARKVEYLELTIEKDFQNEFVEAMPIPHMRDPFPHLKGIVREEILGR